MSAKVEELLTDGLTINELSDISQSAGYLQGMTFEGAQRLGEALNTIRLRLTDSLCRQLDAMECPACRPEARRLRMSNPLTEACEAVREALARIDLRAEAAVASDPADVLTVLNHAATLLAAVEERERFKRALEALGFTRPDGTLCYDGGRCTNRVVDVPETGEYRTTTWHSEQCKTVRAALTGPKEERHGES